eukprot:1963371-Rhodomonas_salina.4
MATHAHMHTHTSTAEHCATQRPGEIVPRLLVLINFLLAVHSPTQKIGVQQRLGHARKSWECSGQTKMEEGSAHAQKPPAPAYPLPCAALIAAHVALPATGSVLRSGGATHTFPNESPLSPDPGPP